MNPSGRETGVPTLPDQITPGLMAALARPNALDLVVELAHDFRTPLASVLVLAELLERGRSGPLTPLQRDQLRLILGAVRSLAALTDDVMDLARGGNAFTAPVAFAVAPVFATVADLTRPAAVAKGLRLAVSSSVDGMRSGHPRAIERVLLNLVTNAIRYTDHGAVEMTARPVPGRDALACFAVRDTGRGISKAAARTLLDPFPDSLARYEPGLSSAGIGLEVCRRLVAALGSDLRLDSRPEHGSRFHFTVSLPRKNDG